MKKINLILIVLLLMSGSAFSETLKLKYFQSDSRYKYRIDLLKLAMEKTEKSDGPYLLEPVDDEMTQKRGLFFLETGDRVNIGFFPSSRRREETFLSVKIPVLRGLLGYRVFIVRKKNLAAFSKIDSLNTLRREFKAGFGSHWADMKILRINNIPVIESAQYENLFRMLSAKRFDYFPRGINEAWNEMAERKDRFPDLTVEPHLAFYYPCPVYYYVNKKDVKLADRIERGLNIATEDGTFKKLFLQYHQDVIEKADLKNRKLFILGNPTLADNTPEPDTGWWLERK